MLTYKQFLLLEKTYEVDKDVDYLFDKADLHQILYLINEGDAATLHKILPFKNDEVLLWSGDSSELKSQDSVSAHNLNPVKIYIGIFKNGSYYSPEKSVIQLSVNNQAFNHFILLNGDWEKINKSLEHQAERFKNEFSASNVKGTFQHELTHWIDDTLHNKFIHKKLLDKNIKGRHNSVNHSFFEINAQIHKIKQLKRDLGEKYNELDWFGLMKKLTSLITNFQRFRNDKEYNELMRKVVLRLQREGLMTDKLRKIPDRMEMELFSSKH